MIIYNVKSMRIWSAIMLPLFITGCNLPPEMANLGLNSFQYSESIVPVNSSGYYYNYPYWQSVNGPVLAVTPVVPIAPRPLIDINISRSIVHPPQPIHHTQHDIYHTQHHIHNAPNTITIIRKVR